VIEECLERCLEYRHNSAIQDVEQGHPHKRQA
jgi:hypothetical protein